MSQNVFLLVVVGVLVLLLLVWVFAAFRRTRVEIEPRAEDQPARRNQALIDAPPVAAAPPAMPDVPVPMEPIADSGIDAPAVPLPVESDAGDDLTRIKGLGPKLAEQLRAMGVTSFAQIAAWDDAEIDRIDAQLGRFQGRIRRDDWPAQAQFLAAGDTAGYESKFGRL